MTWLKNRRSYTWYVVVGADSLSQQSVSNLPGKNGWTLSLVLSDLSHNLWSGHPGFTPSYGPRTDGTRLVVPAQDLTHTAIRHLDTKNSITQINWAQGLPQVMLLEPVLVYTKYGAERYTVTTTSISRKNSHQYCWQGDCVVEIQGQVQGYVQHTCRQQLCSLRYAIKELNQKTVYEPYSPVQYLIFYIYNIFCAIDRVKCNNMLQNALLLLFLHLFLNVLLLPSYLILYLMCLICLSIRCVLVFLFV